MILQIQKYPLVVTYRPGKELLIADTLSRAYLPDEGGNILDEELEVNLINTLPISTPHIRKQTGTDQVRNTTGPSTATVEGNSDGRKESTTAHIPSLRTGIAVMKYLCTTASCSKVNES